MVWKRRALSTDIAFMTISDRPGGMLRVHLDRRLRLALDVLVHDGHVVAAVVGRLAGEHLIQDDAERVDVGALVDLLAEDLLGRHVFRRADHVAGLGELRVALLLRGGDAEVHDLDQARVVDQHVGGLQVAVDDAGLVRHGHAGGDVHRVAHGLVERQRLVVDLVAERVRREVLHRDRVVAADEQEVVDADDVAVRDLARVAQLVHEPLHHLLVLRDVRVQELEHQPLVDDRVLHQQHGAEGALADLLQVLVAALEHVARLERGDVEPLRRCGLAREAVEVGRFGEQRARRLGHAGRALLRVAHAASRSAHPCPRRRASPHG